VVNNSLTDSGGIILSKFHLTWLIVRQIAPTKSLADTTMTWFHYATQERPIMWEAFDGRYMRFEDKTVFVTGGGSGIGRATARRCAREGATVVVSDIDTEGGEETVAGIEDENGLGEAIFEELDVTDAEAVAGMVDDAAAEYGLDVVVNNAGIAQRSSAMEEFPLEERDRVFEINAKGVWNGCRAAIPHLKEGESGAIVNVASLAGVIGQPWSAAYAFTKGGVAKFTRTIAGELGRHGVRVNAVCPGFTDTPMVRGGLESRDDPEAAREKLESQYALKRIGEPEEIAAAICFLASDDASFITGHELVVDGGYSCG
jgi:NAD(P)-dependent dehydrogenase (short-subunit alcohol dehydrogenase family)